MQLFGRLNKKIFLLLIILLLAGFLRLWNLAKTPPGFTPDEASFGYDAYSILKTGKDQWGHKFPLTLESFGDYKSPLYSYIAIPFVGILGLSEFSVRLPNAIIGIASVYIVFLLVGELGKISKIDRKRVYLLQIASSLLLAVSSWHVMMSRGAFEANLVVFFVPCGIYLFLRGLENSKFLTASSVVFGLGLFTYHSAKLIIPIVIFILVVIFAKKLRRKFIVPLLIFLSFFGLLLYSQTLGGAQRISERSITQGALEAGAETKIKAIQNGMNPTLARLLHNKYQVTLTRFLGNYKQYFSWRFLVTNGPAETTYGMIPGVGTVYLVEALLFLGLIPLLVNEKKLRRPILLVIVWLLISPLPAALATGVGYSANRAEMMVVPLAILSSFGLLGLLKFFKGKMTIAFLIILSAWTVYSVYFAFGEYFGRSELMAAQGMLYGRRDAVHFALQNQDSFTQIVLSRKLSEPQIYVAFYGKVNPTTFQEATADWGRYKLEKLSFLDQLGEYKLGKFLFKAIEYKSDSLTSSTLLLGLPDEFPKNADILKTINYPNGEPDILVSKSLE